MGCPLHAPQGPGRNLAPYRALAREWTLRVRADALTPEPHHPELLILFYFLSNQLLTFWRREDWAERVWFSWWGCHAWSGGSSRCLEPGEQSSRSLRRQGRPVSPALVTWGSCLRFPSRLRRLIRWGSGGRFPSSETRSPRHSDPPLAHGPRPAARPQCTGPRTSG